MAQSMFGLNLHVSYSIVIIYIKLFRTMPTEVWNFETMEHREIDPALLNGEYRFPILFHVESGYCKNNDL